MRPIRTARAVPVLVALAVLTIVPPLAHASGITRTQVWAAQERAARREAATERAVRQGVYPMFARDGAWHLSSPSGWTSGYASGTLWLEYQATADQWWRLHALSRQKAIGGSPATPESLNLGARYFPTFARGYALTGDPALKAIALGAAASLAARYDPTVGALRSRPVEDFNVIIDSLMGVSLLYWGAENGGSPEWSQIARQHALTVARDFLRPDGSTYHAVLYDQTTGAVTGKTSWDGYGPESMWARGQAWGICGLAFSYRKTGDPALLDAARRVADRYLADLPPDLAPYWDFRDPAIPSAPRDSSAAAIAASGLIDLAVNDPDPRRRETYAAAARAVLAALSVRPYASLHANPALVLRATVNYHRGQTRVGAAYGDYFYLQALLRLRMLPPRRAPLSLSAARASGGEAGGAVDGSMDTAWTSFGRQHLDLRLAKPGQVAGVRLALVGGDTRAARLRILVSGDGSHWTAVKATMSGGETAGFELYDFPRHTARWVRIECSGTSMDRRNAIAEAEVY